MSAFRLGAAMGSYRVGSIKPVATERRYIWRAAVTLQSFSQHCYEKVIHR